MPTAPVTPAPTPAPVTPVIKKFEYTPERVFTIPNTTHVLTLKELGSSVVLSNNAVILPLISKFLGNLVSLAVQPAAKPSVVTTSGSDVFVSATNPTKSFTIGSGTEVILRKVKLGWEIVTILVIPTIYV